jgi:hypothetical protein
LQFITLLQSRDFKETRRTSHTSLEAPRKVKDRVRIVSSFNILYLPGISKIYTTKPPPNPLPDAMLAPSNDTQSSSKYAEMLINARPNANECPISPYIYIPIIFTWSRTFLPIIRFPMERGHCMTLCLHLSTISICP